MNRTQLISKATELLKMNGEGKVVLFPKQTFHIEDDEGNKKSFFVRKGEKRVHFTAEDVSVILDALVAAVEDSIKKGEYVTLQGFGKLGVKLRKKRATKLPYTNEWVEIAEHYVPSFFAGERLRTCAKVYELSLAEKIGGVDLPIFDDDDEAGGEDDVD